jgi:hypothetical protein
LHSLPSHSVERRTRRGGNQFQRELSAPPGCRQDPYHLFTPGRAQIPLTSPGSRPRCWETPEGRGRTAKSPSASASEQGGKQPTPFAACARGARALGGSAVEGAWQQRHEGEGAVPPARLCSADWPLPGRRQEGACPHVSSPRPGPPEVECKARVLVSPPAASSSSSSSWGQRAGRDISACGLQLWQDLNWSHWSSAWRSTCLSQICGR